MAADALITDDRIDPSRVQQHQTSGLFMLVEGGGETGGWGYIKI